MSLVPSPPQVLDDKPRIGASAAAAAIGLSPYQRPIELWLEMTGQRPRFDGNERTRWGHALEPVIRAHYVEQNRVAVHVPPTSLRHHELPFVSATPDGIVIDLERQAWQWVGPQVKNVGLRQAEAWEQGIPEHYQIQAVVEMAVTQLPRLDFAVLIGGQEYVERTMHRDLEIEASVLEMLAEFWRHVETRTAPPDDGTTAYQKHLLDRIRGKAIIEVKPDAIEAELMREWQAIARAQKELETDETAIKNKLLERMVQLAANGICCHELGKVTVAGGGTSTKWKEVAQAFAAHPDYAALVENNTKASAPSLRRPAQWTKETA